LLIQLRREVYKNELAEQIITHYFVPFAEKKWKIVSKELNISMKEIQDVFDHVQMLNPKPCAEFNNGQTSYIVPDAIIESTNEGLFARLCTDLLPKITLNEQYYNQFVKSEDPQVNRFLQDKFQDYQWIAKGIEQRKETLVRVVTQIINRQPEFFQKGPQHLRPMTMKELAQELDVHESTISRAVREKYVQTPVGTFPLKFFFTSTIQTVSDESTSSSQVKNAISLLIDKENKQNPYSDQEITDYFKTNKGIVVSRRTVAKYRDQLGIPSSSKRKRFE
jgi:RNA polymerase sigma-54 factor